MHGALLHERVGGLGACLGELESLGEGDASGGAEGGEARIHHRHLLLVAALLEQAWHQLLGLDTEAAVPAERRRQPAHRLDRGASDGGIGVSEQLLEPLGHLRVVARLQPRVLLQQTQDLLGRRLALAPLLGAQLLDPFVHLERGQQVEGRHLGRATGAGGRRPARPSRRLRLGQLPQRIGLLAGDGLVLWLPPELLEDGVVALGDAQLAEEGEALVADGLVAVLDEAEQHAARRLQLQTLRAALAEHRRQRLGRRPAHLGHLVGRAADKRAVDGRGGAGNLRVRDERLHRLGLQLRRRRVLLHHRVGHGGRHGRHGLRGRALGKGDGGIQRGLVAEAGVVEQHLLEEGGVLLERRRGIGAALREERHHLRVGRLARDWLGIRQPVRQRLGASGGVRGIGRVVSELGDVERRLERRERRILQVVHPRVGVLNVGHAGRSSPALVREPVPHQAVSGGDDFTRGAGLPGRERGTRGLCGGEGGGSASVHGDRRAP